MPEQLDGQLSLLFNEAEEHRLSEEERKCPQCGETMQEIGKEVWETMVIKPAEAKLCQDVYYTYACESCEKTRRPT